MRKTILAATAAIMVVGGGTATAAKLITGADIKNGSVAGADIRKGSVPIGDLSPATQRLIRRRAAVSGSADSSNVPSRSGANGSNGSNGAQGPKGDKGDKGEPGQALVANVTSAGPGPSGLVPGLPAEPSSVFTADKGAALVSVALPAGRYIIAGTAQFFALGAADGQYGEGRLFRSNGTPQGGSIFSGEVPPAALGGVPGQASASVEVDLPSADTLTFRGRVRGGTPGPSNVGGGANLLVTEVTDAP